MSTIPTRLGLALPLLALSLVFAIPDEGSARGPACTDAYLVCVNDALDGGRAMDDGGFGDEMGSIECAASWAGCVLGRFRRG